MSSRAKYQLGKKSFIAVSGLIDGLSVYAETSVSLLTQFGNSLALKIISTGLGVILGVTESAESIAYDGSLALKRMDSSSCCRDNDGLHLPLNNFGEPAQAEKSYPKIAKAYPLFAFAKNFFNYYFLTMALNTWVEELSGLATATEVTDNAKNGMLINLNPCLIPVVLALYFTFVLPFYLASAAQETINKLSGEEKTTPCYARSKRINNFIISTGPIPLTVNRNLPQLLFLSPNILKTLAGSWWGILIIILDVASLLYNLVTTHKTIKNVEVPIAKTNLGVEISGDATHARLSWLGKFLWMCSLTFESAFSINKLFAVHGDGHVSAALGVSAVLALFPSFMRYLAFATDEPTEVPSLTPSP